MSVISPGLVRFPVAPSSAIATPLTPIRSATLAVDFLAEQTERLALQSSPQPLSRQVGASADITRAPQAKAARRIAALREYLAAPDANAMALLLQYERQGHPLDFSQNLGLMESLAMRLYGSVEQARRAEGKNWKQQLSSSLLGDMVGDLRCPKVSDKMVSGHSLERIKFALIGQVTSQLLQRLLPPSAEVDRATYDAALARASNLATQLTALIAPDPVLYRRDMPLDLKYNDARWWDLQRGLGEEMTIARPAGVLSARELIALGQTIFSVTRSGRPEVPTPRDLVITVFVHNDVDQLDNRAIYERYFSKVSKELINNVPASALDKVTVKFVRQVTGVTDYEYRKSTPSQSVDGLASRLREGAALNHVRSSNPYRKNMLFTSNRMTSEVLGVAQLGGDTAVVSSEQKSSVAHELGHMLGATHEQSEVLGSGLSWGHTTMNSGTDIGTNFRHQLMRFSTANMQTIRDQLVVAANR